MSSQEGIQCPWLHEDNSSPAYRPDQPLLDSQEYPRAKYSPCRVPRSMRIPDAHTHTRNSAWLQIPKSANQLPPTAFIACRTLGISRREEEQWTTERNERAETPDQGRECTCLSRTARLTILTLSKMGWIHERGDGSWRQTSTQERLQCLAMS